MAVVEKARVREAVAVRFAVSLGMVALVLAIAPVALAHGEFQSATPKPGSVARTPPKEVSVTLTEPPARGTVLKVFDGCARNLVRDTSRSDLVLEAALGDGQPGRWAVEFRAISSVDGHSTRDAYGFKVRGKRDCSKDEPAQISGGAGTQIEARPEVEGTDFPIVPFAIGSVAVISAALVLRRVAGR